MNREEHDRWEDGDVLTEIDPSAEIRISHDADRVTAMLPLDGPVIQEWHHRYDALAKAHERS